MNWTHKKKIIGMALATLFISPLAMADRRRRYYDDYDEQYYDSIDRDREAGTIVGSTATGAAIGGFAGGGRGAGIGAAAGFGLGLLSSSGSRHDRHARRKSKKRAQQRAYDRGLVDAERGRPYKNRFNSGVEQDAYDDGWNDAQDDMNMAPPPIAPKKKHSGTKKSIEKKKSGKKNKRASQNTPDYPQSQPTLKTQYEEENAGELQD